VKFSNQSDVDECRPRDTPSYSSSSGLHSREVVVRDQVIRPFPRGPDRNRGYGNAIEPHYKIPISIGNHQKWQRLLFTLIK